MDSKNEVCCATCKNYDCEQYSSNHVCEGYTYDYSNYSPVTYHKWYDGKWRGKL